MPEGKEFQTVYEHMIAALPNLYPIEESNCKYCIAYNTRAKKCTQSVCLYKQKKYEER